MKAAEGWEKIGRYYDRTNTERKVRSGRVYAPILQMGPPPEALLGTCYGTCTCRMRLRMMPVFFDSQGVLR